MGLTTSAAGGRLTRRWEVGERDSQLPNKHKPWAETAKKLGGWVAKRLKLAFGWVALPPLLSLAKYLDTRRACSNSGHLDTCPPGTFAIM